MSPNYQGPYRIGRFGAYDPEAIKAGNAEFDPTQGEIMRHNDGSITIMGQDAEGEPVPVLHVPMRVRAKRGEAWKTSDPEQEAFAAALVTLLNAASRHVSRETSARSGAES